MRLVLGIATVLGIVGPIAAFGLFYLGDRVLHLGHPELQTMMYLLLSVAGHLTIFLTRTRGPFWSIRPAKILWIAVLGTQTVATLIAVYGLFMTPLGWKLAGFVWAYALVWAVVTDRVKLLGYHFLDHAKAEPKSEDKVSQPKLVSKADAPKPEVKAEAKPEAKADPKPDDNAEPQFDAKPKIASDLNAQIATRAYELYKQRSDKESQAIGDWEQAERDIREDDANTTPKAQTKIGPETNTSKLEAGAEVKAGSDSDTKPADTAPAVNDESKPETKDKIPSDVTPQLVKRVHALYEELGREEVQAVQEWEKSEPETLKK
jgi:H+-transporting ATPase